MREVWRGDLPEACDNTWQSLSAATWNSPRVQPHACLPDPGGESEESWLVKEVERGLAQRFAPHDALRLTANGRPPMEVGVVCQMGFLGYFLVTADLGGTRRPTGSGGARPGMRPVP